MDNSKPKVVYRSSGLSFAVVIPNKIFKGKAYSFTFKITAKM